jgi:hypothetical protein
MMMFRIVGVLIAALTLANCSGERLFGDASPSTQPDPTVTMTGRWLLSAPNAPPCGMAFGAAAPQAREGSIAPEGGCPGNFFTSRHWAFEQGGLIIKDHTDQPLAQLRFTNGRFEGTSSAGTPVTLAR